MMAHTHQSLHDHLLDVLLDAADDDHPIRFALDEVPNLAIFFQSYDEYDYIYELQQIDSESRELTELQDGLKDEVFALHCLVYQLQSDHGEEACASICMRMTRDDFLWYLDTADQCKGTDPSRESTIESHTNQPKPKAITKECVWQSHTSPKPRGTFPSDLHDVLDAEQSSPDEFPNEGDTWDNSSPAPVYADERPPPEPPPISPKPTRKLTWTLPTSALNGQHHADTSRTTDGRRIFSSTLTTGLVTAPNQPCALIHHGPPEHRWHPEPPQVHDGDSDRQGTPHAPSAGPIMANLRTVPYRRRRYGEVNPYIPSGPNDMFPERYRLQGEDIPRNARPNPREQWDRHGPLWEARLDGDVRRDELGDMEDAGKLLSALICVMIVELDHSYPFNPPWPMHLDDPHMTRPEYEQVMKSKFTIKPEHNHDTPEEALTLAEMIHRRPVDLATRICKAREQQNRDLLPDVEIPGLRGQWYRHTRLYFNWGGREHNHACRIQHSPFDQTVDIPIYRVDAGDIS